MSRTALVCEDDPVIRAMMTTMLTRDGMEVHAVNDGEAAMVRLGEGEYDLIVLDLMMPGVDGFAVADYLAESKPRRLKRVMVTSAAPLALASRLPEGICTILPKPFDMDEFLRQARSCSEDTLTRARRRLAPSPAPA